jgi:hypothetical protein
LRQLAEASGGRVLQTAEDLAGVLASFPSTPGDVLVHQTPLWDRPSVWGLLLALLACEWALRRRAGFG